MPHKAAPRKKAALPDGLRVTVELGSGRARTVRRYAEIVDRTVDSVTADIRAKADAEIGRAIAELDKFIAEFEVRIAQKKRDVLVDLGVGAGRRAESMAAAAHSAD